MPGVNLNLVLPTLSDTMAVVVTKTATALSAIQTDLTPQITPSQINFNSNVAVNGMGLNNVGFVQLASGTVNAIPGSIFYLGGEFYVYTGQGQIKITQNGSLNISTVGGIGGDYTTVSALLAYINASVQYRFYQAGGAVLADTYSRNAVVNNTGAGTVTIGASASLGAPKSFYFKSLPTASVGLLAYDASGVGEVVDGSAVTITAPPTFGGTVQFNHLNVSGKLEHTDWQAEIPWSQDGGVNTNITFASNGGERIIQSNNINWTYTSLPVSAVGCRVGDRVKTVSVGGTYGLGNLVITLKKRVGVAAPTTVQSVTIAGASAGGVLTISVPAAIVSNERWYVTVSGANNLEPTYNLFITWDQV